MRMQGNPPCPIPMTRRGGLAPTTRCRSSWLDTRRDKDTQPARMAAQSQSLACNHQKRIPGKERKTRNRNQTMYVCTSKSQHHPRMYVVVQCTFTHVQQPHVRAPCVCTKSASSLPPSCTLCLSLSLSLFLPSLCLSACLPARLRGNLQLLSCESAEKGKNVSQ